MATVRRAKPRAASATLCAFTAVLCSVAAFVSGCASPGEPTTRRPPIPTSIGDLTAKQQGNDVILTFALPTQSIDHHPLKQTPTVQVYWLVTPVIAATNANSAASAPSKPVLLATLPPATVDSLTVNRAVTFIEPLNAADFGGQTSLNAVYMIRTYEKEKKPSSDSNAVAITLHPSYPAIADAKADNARDGVGINWTPPTQTITGTTPPINGYRIYRATAADASHVTTPGAPAANGKVPLQRVADAAAPPFLDTQIELGAHYVYSVRTLAKYGDAQLESSDSNLTDVTAKDLFAPAAPEGLIVTLIPAQAASGGAPASPAYLDLSWAIAPEHDVVGYNVYRAENSGAKGVKQNPELLPTPAFRDMNGVPGHVYYYAVTAVDRAGNESAPSAPVQGTLSEDAPPASPNP
jgi:hypothetical protein